MKKVNPTPIIPRPGHHPIVTELLRYDVEFANSMDRELRDHALQINDLTEMIGRPTFRVKDTVNFAAAGDSPAAGISFTLPVGYSRYRVIGAYLSGASGNISTATIGLFPASGGAGTAIVTGGSAITVTTGAEDTNNNFQALTIANPVTKTLTPLTLYPRVGATVAQTAIFTLWIEPIS